MVVGDDLQVIWFGIHKVSKLSSSVVGWFGLQANRSASFGNCVHCSLDIFLYHLQSFNQDCVCVVL